MIARRALKGRDAAYDEIGIALVDDPTMRDANLTFRGLDRTTDVLSFDLRSARTPGEPRTGEVVISTDRVVVQARRYRVHPSRELARLAIHGLLHLQGFDHRRAPERRRMRALEREILAAVTLLIEGLVREPKQPAVGGSR